MSRSKKWKEEWSFFLGNKPKRSYNHLCKQCQMDCKQSFRVQIIECCNYKPWGRQPRKNKSQCRFLKKSPSCIEEKSVVISSHYDYLSSNVSSKILMIITPKATSATLILCGRGGFIAYVFVRLDIHPSYSFAASSFVMGVKKLSMVDVSK